MSNILVKFYRVNSDSREAILIRTEYCDNVFEADAIAEQEAGHYDYVSIIDLNGSGE